MANREKKAARLELRLSPAELDRIRAVAASGRGCTVSEFVRDAVNRRVRVVEAKSRVRRRARARARIHGGKADPK